MNWLKKLLTGMIVPLMALSCSACVASPMQRASDSTYKIVMNYGTSEEGSCSATAIAIDKIITASHCFDGVPKTLDIGKYRVTVDQMFQDETDHTIVVIKERIFPEYVKIDFDYELNIGERVFVFGNPASWEHMYREGLVSNTLPIDIMNPAWTGYFFDITGFFGDSGSCFFNKKGVCVAILSAAQAESHESHSAQFIISFDFTFDANVLKGLDL